MNECFVPTMNMHIKWTQIVCLLLYITAITTKYQCKGFVSASQPSIYSMDHFIELVEKIERHPKMNMKSLDAISHAIRGLVYNDDLWNTLLGESESLPSNILSSSELHVLVSMLHHGYMGVIETGVVWSGNDTIAIGHVINGICAGTRRNKRLSLGGWQPNAGDPVDNLYAATLSGTLARTGLDNIKDPSRAIFGPSGSWRPSTDCPEAYQKNIGPYSSATNAQLIGDMDGFILGSTIQQWVRRGVRLGQLLRMYYSSGICYDTSYVYCHRYMKIKQLVMSHTLFGQVIIFTFPYYYKHSSIYKNVKPTDVIKIAKNLVLNRQTGYFSYIDRLVGAAGSCDVVPYDGHCELPANVVFLMDESGSITEDNYQIEKSFVNKIINMFHVSRYQTRVAVIEYSSEPKLTIKLNEYESKTRLTCAVKKFEYKGGATHTGKAIQLAHDSVLLPAQSTDQSTNTPQIVVLLTDGKSNDPDKNSLSRAVKQIKQDIRDLTLIAVGIGKYDIEELRLIATDKTEHVFEASDFSGLINLVSSLKNRTCTTPVIVDIDFHPDANITVISAFVSPSKPRYFVVPSERFNGVKDLYIEITPIYGTIALYASRNFTTPGPQRYTYKIDPLDVGENVIFYLDDPCKGYNSSYSACPNLYLTIYGDSSTLSCSELSCTLPSQIKFTIKRGSSADVHTSSCQQLSFSIVCLVSTMIAVMSV